VAFNLETTGLDTETDRVVEFNAVGVSSQPTLQCPLSYK
jgi:DNA polymerase III epsilon subunit-like protein